MIELSQYRPVGSTGILVSPIGLGTVKLGRDKGVKYPTQFTIPDDRQAATLIDYAHDLGINLIDTAPAYGNSEQRLGILLKGQRSRWVICSKVGEEFNNGESHFDFTPEHTRLSIERSLKRLNTDFIDMVLVHSDGNDELIINQMGTLDALAQLKQKGLIGAYGMSTKTVAGGKLAVDKSDVVMVTYNLQHTEDGAVIDYAQQKNKGVLIKKAFASGHIPQQGNPLAFIQQYQTISSVIVGTINTHHLKQNCALL